MWDFIWITSCVYISFFSCFYYFKKAERRSLVSYPFAKLKKYDTPTNRFLLTMLDKYRYIAPRKKDDRYAPKKKERYYFYYTKKIYTYLMLLAIPWLATVYIMDWYLIKAFVKWHLIFSVIIGNLPVIILVFLRIICDIKLQQYSREI